MEDQVILSDFKNDLLKNLWQLRRQGCKRFVSVVSNIKPPKKFLRKQEVGETVMKIIGISRGSDINLEFGVSNEFPDRIKEMQKIINSVLVVFNKK